MAVDVSDRVLTLPNAISLLRLLGVPLFVWLVLGPHDDGAALGVLAGAGVTDYLDGKVARRYHSISRLGQLLDPAADRLYILATIAALTARGILPIWLAVLIPARDLALAALLPVLRRHGYGVLPVHFLGKAGTFCLLYAFPLLLLGAWHGTVGDVARPVAWAFTLWGTALYWWAGLLYAVQVRHLVAAERPVARRPEEVRA